MSTLSRETAQDRLDAVRILAKILQDSPDTQVWQVALAIDQLCMGTITTAQAHAQLEN